MTGPESLFRAVLAELSSVLDDTQLHWRVRVAAADNLAACGTAGLYALLN